MTKARHHEAHELITAIGATASRTQKEDLLRFLAATEIGEFVLKAAYDPMVTYGIKIDKPPAITGTSFFTIPLVKPLLDKLARRELTGNAAEATIASMIALLDRQGVDLLYWILNKDLKCGINVTTVNGVIPGLIPVFSVARAHPYTEKKIRKWPVFGEPKLDGMRVTFVCRDGNPGFFTRTGKRLPALDNLIAPIMETYKKLWEKPSSLWTGDEARLIPYISRGGYPNFILDGEIMTGLFASTGAVRRKGEQSDDAEFHMFDILSWDDFDAVGEAGPDLMTRRSLLQAFRRNAASDRLQITVLDVLQTDAEVQAAFNTRLNTPLATYLARGNAAREAELMKILIDEQTGQPKMLEGLMVKQPDGLYEKKKGYNWMKLKAEETEDLVVVGFFNGEPDTKYENSTGGLIVDRKGVHVRVGGGFSDVERDQIAELWRHDCSLLRTDHDCGPKGDWINPDRFEAVMVEYQLKLIGRMIEVKFHEVTPDGSLRHPVFKRFRDDKNGEVEDKAVAVAAMIVERPAAIPGFGRF